MEGRDRQSRSPSAPRRLNGHPSARIVPARTPSSREAPRLWNTQGCSNIRQRERNARRPHRRRRDRDAAGRPGDRSVRSDDPSVKTLPARPEQHPEDEGREARSSGRARRQARRPVAAKSAKAEPAAKAEPKACAKAPGGCAKAATEAVEKLAAMRRGPQRRGEAAGKQVRKAKPSARKGRDCREDREGGQGQEAGIAPLSSRDDRRCGGRADDAGRARLRAGTACAP